MMMQVLQEHYTEVLAVALALLAVVGFWKSLIPSDQVSKRLKKINDRRDVLIKENLSTQRKGDRFKKGSSMGFVRRSVERLKLMGNEQVKEIQLSLAQAGYRSREALMVFLFIRTVLPFIMAIVGLVLVYLVVDPEMKGIFKLLIFVSCVFSGYYLPAVFIKNMKQKRTLLIQKALPDCLDLLVICAQAGLSLDSALNRVAREMGDSYPELSDELSLTSVELGFLQERSEALYNLAKRVDLSQMRSLINTLIQTEKYGTPLSQSLRVLSQEYRDERMMRAEEKAARLPAILTLPMIIFILPPLFIVLLAPGIISAIDSFNKM